MRVRFILAVLTLGLIGATAVALPAGATGVIGPDQFFTGVINGKIGGATAPIVIRMACFGPVHPGETGHPLPGQSLAVHELYPPVAAPVAVGFTGNDSVIGVFFGAPPPVGNAGGAPVLFKYYDTPQPLPTSLTLPCAGPGTVWFTPLPVLPPSRAARVPVIFVGQP